MAIRKEISGNVMVTRKPKKAKPIDPKLDTGYKDKNGKVIYTTNKVKYQGYEFTVVQNHDGKFELKIATSRSTVKFLLEKLDPQDLTLATFNW